MMTPTLRQLRYLDALARHGRFGRAADACAISQPALSMQIKELEDALGAPLFERTAKQVQLTAFGGEILQRAQSILRAVADLEDYASAAHDGSGGRLRLGVIPTVAPYLLPSILRGLGSAFPDLSVAVRETITLRLIDELSDGHLDAGIVALPISEPGLDVVELFHEAFVLVRPLAEADQPVPSRSELRRMRLLLLEEGHCFREQALSFCETSQHGDGETLDGSSLGTLVQLAGAGLGVTLIPEMAVAVETRSAPIAVQRFTGPEPTRTLGLVWRRTRTLARPPLQLADALIEAHRRHLSARAGTDSLMADH